MAKSKYVGQGATIAEGLFTAGKSCVIESWDPRLRKYKVDFDGGWCGWYKRSELCLDKGEYHD